MGQDDIAYARSAAGDGRERLWFLGEGGESIRMVLDCLGWECWIDRSTSGVTVVRGRSRVSRETKEAWVYARTLASFEGDPFDDAEHLPFSAGPIGPAFGAGETQRHEWVDDVLAHVRERPLRERWHAGAEAHRLGRTTDALELYRSFVPPTFCGLDRRNVEHFREFSELAASAGRTGWSISALVRSFGPSKTHYGSQYQIYGLMFCRDYDDWATGLAGVDLTLLLEGMVAELGSEPGLLTPLVVKYLADAAPAHVRAGLRRRALSSTMDPWNRVLLLSVTGAVPRPGSGPVELVWEDAVDGPALDVSPMVAGAVASLTPAGRRGCTPY